MAKSIKECKQYLLVSCWKFLAWFEPNCFDCRLEKSEVAQDTTL